jgi:hypothetical protein
MRLNLYYEPVRHGVRRGRRSVDRRVGASRRLRRLGASILAGTAILAGGVGFAQPEEQT